MGTAGNSFHAVFPLVCPIGHQGTAQMGQLAVLALAGSQKLLLACLALVAVVVFGLWPIVRPKRYNQRALRDLASKQRLKSEIEKHAHD